MSENGQVFSVLTALIRGTGGQNRSVFDKNIFFKTATKSGNFQRCFGFFESNIVCRLGPQPTKPVPNRRIPAPTYRIRTHNRLFISDRQPLGGTTPSATYHNANAVPMSQKIPENSPVAPSYGPNTADQGGGGGGRGGSSERRCPPPKPNQWCNNGNASLGSHDVGMHPTSHPSWELTAHPYPNVRPQCEHRPLPHGASDTSKGTVT